MKQAFLFITLFATSVLLSLGGCARPIPHEVYHPKSSQYKMQSVRHWDQLAEEIAARLKNTLNLTFTSESVVKPALYIREIGGGNYAQSFQHLLKARLLQQGINVINNTTHPDTLVMDYHMQVVHHPDYDPMGEMYSEVVLSTSVAMGDQYVFASSDTYYINTGNAGHYDTSYRDIQVVGQ